MKHVITSDVLERSITGNLILNPMYVLIQPKHSRLIHIAAFLIQGSVLFEHD